MEKCNCCRKFPIVYKGRIIDIFWRVFKNHDKVSEDFIGTTTVKTFLCFNGTKDVIPNTIETDTSGLKYLKLTIDTANIPAGAYDLKVVWIRPRHPNNPNIIEEGQINTSWNGAVFGITENEEDDNTCHGVSYHEIIDTTSYAQVPISDGLSAYEIAVIHGFEGTEEDWISQIGVNGGSVSIDKVADYLYKTEYDTIDYNYAKAHIEDEEPPVGACSALYANGLVGRNFDWKYNYEAAFFVRTHNSQGRYAVDGIAGMKSLTIQKADSREHTNAYKILPFMLQDGINEKGLFAEMNVVPSKGNTHTTPLVEKRDSISALMLVRYILDHFDNVDDAVNYVKNYVEVNMPAKLTAMGYELHYMIADKNGDCTVLEFINNGIVFIDSNISTNFHLYGVSFLPNGNVYTNRDVPTHLPSSIGIEEYGSGLERWNVLNGATISYASSMRTAIDSVKYSNAYTIEQESKFWYSEFVGGDITVDTRADDADFLARIQEYRQKWEDKSRETGEVWITTHSCVYDLNAGVVDVQVQESNEQHRFSMNNDAEVPDGAVTTQKIADGAVTGQKIAPSTITEDKMDAAFVNKVETKAEALHVREFPTNTTVTTEQFVSYGFPEDFDSRMKDNVQYLAIRILGEHSTILVLRFMGIATDDIYFEDMENLYMFRRSGSSQYTIEKSQKQ